MSRVGYRAGLAREALLECGDFGQADQISEAIERHQL
ncbi:MAG: hypothetical protein ACI8TP_002124, partial [Acidimicrobiales bacterium]